MNSAETTPEVLTEEVASEQGAPFVPTIKGSKSSSDISPNSQSSPGSPDLGPTHIEIGRPVCSDLMDVPVYQLNDKTVFVLITFPTTSLVTAVVGLTANRQSLSPQYKVASPYGDQNGFNFDQTTRFVPGDYCFALVFKSAEEAQSISLVRVLLQAEPISNLMVSQMIFGLYRALGFEPSHVMKYPTRSVSSGSPFYRKIRNETAKLSERLSTLETAVRSPPTDVSSLCERIEALEAAVKTPPTVEIPDFSAIEKQLSEISQQLGRLESLLGDIRGQPIVTVEQIEDKLKDLKKSASLVSAYVQRVEAHQEKGSSESIPFEMFEQLILEKEMYLNKLKEAEDYIDYLTAEEEKKSVRQEQWFRPTWGKKSTRR
uniref:Uncharacterized protein n=1 Tax=viral metagenome TaxID=1070528 RepID=A0A6C0IWG9_9ZZZZ